MRVCQCLPRALTIFAEEGKHSFNDSCYARRCHTHRLPKPKNIARGSWIVFEIWPSFKNRDGSKVNGEEYSASSCVISLSKISLKRFQPAHFRTKHYRVSYSPSESVYHQTCHPSH